MTSELTYASIGGTGLEAGTGVRAPGANGNGRRNVAEVIE
jgi:hypothetical protein